MAFARQKVTDANRGPIINVATWTMLVVAVLAALTKVSSKFFIARKLQLDDGYIFGSMLMAIGYTVALLYQVEFGLGRHEDTLNRNQRDTFGKAGYTSELFFVVSVGLAKMGILHFLLTLAQEPKRRKITLGVVIFTAVTIVVGVFPVAFQCAPPRTWDVLSGKCNNRTGFWMAFGVLDAITDLTTVILPIYLLATVQINRKKRIGAMAAFCTRIFVIPVIIVRLVFINNTAASLDRTFDDYPISITTSVHITLSILTACIPFLRPVMDSLQSGILAGDVQTVGASGDGSRSYALQDASVAGWKAGGGIRSAYRNSVHKGSEKSKGPVTIVEAEAGKGGVRANSNDSDEGLIQKHTTFSVRTERR